MLNNQKQLNLLGLATRANLLTTGEEIVLSDIKKTKVTLVIFASDCSENTKKKLINKCQFYGVNYIEKFTTAQISHAIGKKRSICGFLNKGFAQKFLILNEEK